MTVPVLTSPPRARSGRAAVWVLYVLLGLSTIGMLGATTFGWVAPLVAVAVVAFQWRRPPSGVAWTAWQPDTRDLRAITVFYAGVVVLFRLAFGVFTQDRTLGLFLCFAAGLILGVAGPVVYTVRRRRPLDDLGLTVARLRQAVALGLLFGGVEFAATLWGYNLPKPVDWVPLLVMAVVVGFFEAIFYRGFVQTRLEASFGTLPGIAGAATLYALYHVGYGMSAKEMVFLFGLGVVFAVAYRLARNTLVLWPLLLPLGSFFNTVDSGDITMPWAAILGFLDVAAVMVGVLFWARRRATRTKGRITCSTLQTT